MTIDATAGVVMEEVVVDVPFSNDVDVVVVVVRFSVKVAPAVLGTGSPWKYWRDTSNTFV